MSNESSGSLLSSDVPGYEIWTQIVRDMPGNMMVIKCYSDLTVTKKIFIDTLQMQFSQPFLQKLPFSCAHMKAENLRILKLSLLYYTEAFKPKL